MATIVTKSQSADPADWQIFYDDLQSKGHIPNAASKEITAQTAIFRGMYFSLSDIQEEIRSSEYNPIMTVIYADVLNIDNQTNWLLQSTGLVIFSRRIEVGTDASILLDYQKTSSAQLVIFALEFTGQLEVSAVKDSKQQPIIFNLSQANICPGVSIGDESGTPTSQALKLSQGIGFQLPEDLQLYLNNAFIYASLLYDQNQSLALSIFLWVKGWASQSDQMEELFYRSTSMSSLLNSQINASNNGAVFVPYLSTQIYTSLAKAFAGEASKYESDYQQLSTQKVLTDDGIELAKTLVANSQSETNYVTALLKQANSNWENAVAAVSKAQSNFNNQKIVVSGIAAKFQQIGIPDYEREQTIKAIVSLVSAVVTFGAGIAAMAVGDEAAAPAAAEGAINSAKTVANAASTGAEVAKTASKLSELMAKLKKLVAMLQKVYELANAVKTVADNIGSAKGQIEVIQKMQDTTDGADLSAADGWAIYKIQADDVLQDPINKKIEFAEEYKQALDILVIYGQSLSANQLAVIKAGQESAALTFQLHYAQQKQANLQQLVNKLKAGEKPILEMMQQFYQKYLDRKSSLFAALKNYQASYFYWALRKSSVRPKIVDSVTDLNAGIHDITEIVMDQANALNQFFPQPQPMKNILFEIEDPSILKELHENGQTTWVLPIDSMDFAGLNRVRLSNIQIWLEGAKLNGNSDSIYMNITTAGNYLDRYKGTNYQFDSKPLTRSFKYKVASDGLNPDWRFDNGELGFVQIPGEVDKEVAYAYFVPTPFSEWTISLEKNNQGLDYSNISKITMYFEGTAIGSAIAATARKKKIQKILAHA